jgi:hypothetical protein
MKPEGRFLPFQLLDLSSHGLLSTGCTGREVRSLLAEAVTVLAGRNGKELEGGSSVTVWGLVVTGGS